MLTGPNTTVNLISQITTTLLNYYQYNFRQFRDNGLKLKYLRAFQGVLLIRLIQLKLKATRSHLLNNPFQILYFKLKSTKKQKLIFCRWYISSFQLYKISFTRDVLTR